MNERRHRKSLVNMNELELSEVTLLKNSLGCKSINETFRSAVKLTLASRNLADPMEIEGEISFYDQTLDSLRTEISVLTAKVMGAKKIGTKKALMADLKVVEGLVKLIRSTKSLEDSNLLSPKERAELELKKDGMEIQKDALEHRKEMDLLDRGV